MSGVQQGWGEPHAEYVLRRNRARAWEQGREAWRQFCEDMTKPGRRGGEVVAPTNPYLDPAPVSRRTETTEG